jgi:polar amino acid transport system substrate-binding protein
MRAHILFSRISLIAVILVPFILEPTPVSADNGHSEPVLRVGMELSYPPFEMMNEKGQPAGLSVDLALALGQYLHKSVQIANMPFEGLIPALKTGLIDIVISSMAITPERAQSIAFSEPYCRSGLALLLKKESVSNAIDDLDRPGVVVAVKLGTTGDLYARAHLQKANIIRLQQAAACALEVGEGRADAFIYDQLSVMKFHKRFLATSRMNLESFAEEPWGMGLAKGNDDLRCQVNEFLTEFRANGGFKQFGDKYFREEKIELESQGLPFYF